MTRPDPPSPIEGYVWTPVPDEDWTADPDEVRYISRTQGCRYGNQWTGFCGKRIKAVLYRGRTKRAYGYCDDPVHMYGRWIEDGEVLGWRPRRPTGSDVPTAATGSA